MRGGWAFLAVVAAGVLALDALAFGSDRPLLDRRGCLDEPSRHTLTFDRTVDGDAAYRFVYDRVFGFATHDPWLPAAPACTLGWRGGVAALRVGDRLLLVHVRGAHVERARLQRLPSARK